MASSVHVIAELEKNRTERLRIALDRYHEQDLIDVRITTQLTDSSGQWVPTKKGIALRIAQLPALLSALQEAQAQAQAKGLLPATGAA